MHKKLIILFKNIDKHIAIVGEIVALILIVYGFFSEKNVGIFIGILLCISCSLWLKKRDLTHLIADLPVNIKKIFFLTIIFCSLYICSLIIIFCRENIYERPLSFFVIISIMTGIIACEIIIAKKEFIFLILLQIVIFGSYYSWTQQLITPGLVGLDPWFHMFLTNIIINEGFLPLHIGYTEQPFFHVTIALTSIVTSLSYKNATMISISFFQILCNSVLIFLIGNGIFSNYRIGLMAALTVIITPLHILMSYWPIPNGFAAIFLVFIVFLYFIKNFYKNDIKYFLLIPIMIALIITHPLVAACTAILLFSIWFSSFFYGTAFPIISKKKIEIVIPLGFTMGMFMWWMYASHRIYSLSEFIKEGFSFKVITNTIPNLVNSSLIEDIIFVAGDYLFITLSFFGVLFMISHKGNRLSFSTAIISVIPLLISFISYISQSNIIGYRWMYISHIFLSIPFALAIYILGISSKKDTIQVFFPIFCIMCIFSFLTFIGPFGSNDNNFLTEKKSESSYFTQSELISGIFFSNYFSGVLSSDDFFAKNALEYVYKLPMNSLNTIIFSNLNELNHDGAIKIIRERFFYDLSQKGLTSTNYHDFQKNMEISGFNRIYQSNGIAGYVD